VGDAGDAFEGVSGMSVARFADSSVPGGVLVGCAGGGCRPAIGWRPAHPEQTRLITNKTAMEK
jgi:hypothetical protein